MIDPTIPLLNAQQQNIAPLVNAVATRPEMIAQASKDIVAALIEEESKKLDKLAEDPNASSITDEEQGSSHFSEKEQTPREPEENIETAPSYHNPLAGHLLSTKV